MATCAKCGNNIGFLSRTYSCVYCGRTLCSNCKEVLKFPTGKICNIYELLDLPYADIITREPPLISTRKDVSCKVCYYKFLSEVNKIKNAISSCKKIELLPATYRGKRKTIGEGKFLESLWHEDWADCDEELGAQAIYLGYDCVMNIEKERDTVTYEETKDNGKGTYTRSYTVWKKSGYAYKLK